MSTLDVVSAVVSERTSRHGCNPFGTYLMGVPCKSLLLRCAEGQQGQERCCTLSEPLKWDSLTFMPRLYPLLCRQLQLHTFLLYSPYCSMVMFSLPVALLGRPSGLLKQPVMIT